MADYSKAYGSLNAKKDAKWFTDDQGGEFLVAPLNNPTFKVQSMKTIKTVDVEDADATIYSTNEPYVRLLAEYILLDWKEVSFEDAEGKTIDKYSVDNARLLMMSYEVIAAFVLAKSTELQDENVKLLKGVKKK